jgi:hypothetical protein
VQAEFLTPGVQHAEKTDFRAEMSRITSDFAKGFRAGAQQQAIDELLVL